MLATLVFVSIFRCFILPDNRRSRTPGFGLVTLGGLDSAPFEIVGEAVVGAPGGGGRAPIGGGCDGGSAAFAWGCGGNSATVDKGVPAVVGFEIELAHVLPENPLESD